MFEKHHQGYIGETQFVAAAAERGYWIGQVQPTAPYDFLMDKHDGSKILRIQCKYRTIKKGAVDLEIAPGRMCCGYSSANIDAFAVYVPEMKVVALIPVQDLEGSGHVSLRVTPAKNNQAKKVRELAPYLTW